MRIEGHSIFRALLLKVWFLDQLSWPQLTIYYKNRTLVPNSDLLNQILHCTVVLRPAGDMYVHLSFRQSGRLGALLTRRKWE
jgi:hypothetical protein